MVRIPPPIAKFHWRDGSLQIYLSVEENGAGNQIAIIETGYMASEPYSGMEDIRHFVIGQEEWAELAEFFLASGH